MERIQDTKASGLTGSALHTWGMLFLTLGIVGKSILQNRLLNLGQISAQQLLEAMQGSDTVMIYATLALVLQALETCAVPIFAFLLAEGVQHTANFRNYCLRVAGLAVLSEIPYNLAMSGKMLDLSSRNPVFGLVMALIMVYFYRRFSEKSVFHTLIRVAITVSAILWCSMLSVKYGGCLIFVFVVMWMLRKNPSVRNIAGASAALVCSLSSMFFMASPMGVMTIHFYNGEKGEQNRAVNYLAYPVLLLAVWAAGAFFLG